MFENLTQFPKMVHSAQWGTLGDHIDIVTSFNQLQAFMGLYPSLFGIVLCDYLDPLIELKKQKSVTFEPFEPQKR